MPPPNTPPGRADRLPDHGRTMPGVPVAPESLSAPALPDLPGDDPAERHRLPGRTLTYWRLRAVVASIVGVAVVALLALVLTGITPGVRWTAVALLALWCVVSVVVAPALRYRLFWYSVSSTEIDLQHGALVQTRTVVPMLRVQHLKSEQGLLARRFRLADLHVHTAAGTVVLRALDEDQATQIRNRIADAAGLADDT